MLLTAAEVGPTQDAHRSYEVFEDGPASPAEAAGGGDSRSGARGGGFAASSYFKGAAASVRRGLLGRNTPFRTPYGIKPLVYADWTATGRAVASIETFVADQVVPMFGNTHTTTSITGAQTTCFRHEARQIIAQAVNAKVTGRAAEDVVLFAGSGATAAVAKLVSALGLAGPLPAGWKPDDRPVIFVGPYEHHSNLLPWRESCGEVIPVRENPLSGGMDLADLEEKLRRFATRKLKIGSFSAASNVTGVLEDVDRVTATLHRAGALAVWDYATAAPYVRVDMNPTASGLEVDQALVSKDAIFFSGHKFVGGPGTPGVLVAKKRLLHNAVPGTVGGGTVFFVTEQDHRYLSNKEEREEGGTPDILGSIRLGLAVQMKEGMGGRALQEREAELAELGLKTLRAHKGIVVLGDSGKKRLPIFSFLVEAANGGRFLHYNFVCALLNDLFGVQSRGGCQCAGPYSQLLLGLTLADTRAVEAELLRKHELLRPGFSRLSLSYVNSDREAKYILDAVLFVADHGASFLPYYRLNHKTGEWKHKTRFTRFPERRWLGKCDYGFPCKVLNASSGIGKGNRAIADSSAGMNGAVAATTAKTPTKSTAGGKAEKEDGGQDDMEAEMEAMMDEAFEDAVRHLGAAEAGIGEDQWQGSEDVLGQEGEALRWFLYPWEGGGAGGIRASTSSSCVVAERKACIINPKVYVGVAADGGAEAATTRLEDDGGSGTSGGVVGVVPPAAGVGAERDGTETEAAVAAAAAGGQLEEKGRGGTTSARGPQVLVAVAAAEMAATGAGAVPPTSREVHGSERESSEESGSGVYSPDATSAAGVGEEGGEGRRGSIPPPAPFLGGGGHGGGGGTGQRSAAGAASPDTGGDKSAKHRKWQPDDSRKYPLRQANGGGDGKTRGFLLTAEAPAFLASLPAANGGRSGTSSASASVNGGTGTDGQEEGDVLHIANGGGGSGGGSTSKLKGYEEHMSALGKLGAGSAQSRLFPTPGKKLMKAVGQAVQAWKMIEEGDRLCLGLSGGKDSMTLLHVLLHLQKRAPINFEVACATVDPQTASFDPSPLIPYLERLGVKLHYLSSPIIEQAKTSMQGDSLCAFCARMKRGLLYSCCREQGYNKLVLAQHLDDLAESFIMSALHNGQVRTMKANYKVEAGDVRVIRPLCYVREAATKDFARANRLPIVNENCPACFEEPKERHRVKKMLAKEESLFPTMYANLRKALVPLMDDEAYVSMNKSSSEVAARQVERYSRPPTRRQKHTHTTNGNAGDDAEASPSPIPRRNTVTSVLTAVQTRGNGATAAPSSTAAPEHAVVRGMAGTEAHDGQRGNTLRLAKFSDESLERELARRRGVVVGAAGVVVGAEGACGQAGGVCVPCFEIM